MPSTRASLTVLIRPELRIFVRGGDGQVRVVPSGQQTVGQLVQALGVPLTEVGGLLLDGREVPAQQRAAAGGTLEVSGPRVPQPTPTDPPRFLLDVHLGALARRLRLLGLAVAWSNDAGDAELVERARAEDRVLLTQDRGLLMRRALRAGALVRGSGTEQQLADVLDRFAPALAPLTRCTACGGQLVAVPKAEVADRLEPGTRRSYDEFSRCTACGRVYWRGAHARRIDEMVAGAR
jgi:uncharacterized protein with PIN domain